MCFSNKNRGTADYVYSSKLKKIKLSEQVRRRRVDKGLDNKREINR